MRAQKMHALKKIATYARSMEAHTPLIIPRSAVITRRMECEELHPIKEKVPGMTGIPRSPSHKYLHAWKNLRSSSRKPAREARNVVVMRKVIVTPTLLEVLGQVVPGITLFVVRNLKLRVN